MKADSLRLPGGFGPANCLADRHARRAAAATRQLPSELGGAPRQLSIFRRRQMT